MIVEVEVYLMVGGYGLLKMLAVGLMVQFVDLKDFCSEHLKSIVSCVLWHYDSGLDADEHCFQKCNVSNTYFIDCKKTLQSLVILDERRLVKIER